MTFLANSNLKSRPLKWGILGASTIIISKDIDKYAFMCGSNFNDTDFNKDRSQQDLDYKMTLDSIVNNTENP